MRFYLLSMTKITPDDTLESLYKLRIGESDQLTSRFSSNNFHLKKCTEIEKQALKLEGRGSPRFSDPKYARDGRSEKSSRITS